MTLLRTIARRRLEEGRTVEALNAYSKHTHFQQSGVEHGST